MNDQKQQASSRIKEANNILVTVSANPSVDQLAACIGITLALNKMGKHATAVFSGEVPSILEFLQPEKTIEKNTDSLRDFIIALDKSKADKLRYKVEDKVVKIFITPYRTSISNKDLEFSQGDFNVDVVLAIGVHSQADLDQAITAHGRILHDAAVITMNIKPGGELGSINWLDPTASSLAELTAQLLESLDKSVMDEQIATAMLTGIVAETERFSNSKTTPSTMTISAALMTAGANQQLVATKLEAPTPPPVVAQVTPIAIEAPTTPPRAKKSDDGTLEIVHEKNEQPADVPKEQPATHEPAEPPASKPQPEPEQPAAQPEPPTPEPQPEPEPEISTPVEPPKPPQIQIDEHGSLGPIGGQPSDEPQLPPREPKVPPTITHHSEGPKMVLQPPMLGGQLTANSVPDSYDQPTDPLTNSFTEQPKEESAAEQPVITDAPAFGTTIMPPDVAPTPAPVFATPVPSEPPAVPDLPLPEPTTEIQDDKTLTDIERAVHSSHLDSQPVSTPPAPTPTPTEPAFVVPEPAPPVPPASTPPMPLPEPVTQASAAPAAGLNPFSTTTPAPSFDIPSPVVTTPSEPAAPEPVIPEQAPPAIPVADNLPPAADADLQSARDAVLQALNSGEIAPPEQPAAFNAQPLGDPLNGGNAQPLAAPEVTPSMPDFNAANPTAALAPAPAWDPATAPFQPAFAADPVAQPPQAPSAIPSLPVPAAPPFDPLNPGGVTPGTEDPNAPPPVPPPMMPPTQPY